MSVYRKDVKEKIETVIVNSAMRCNRRNFNIMYIFQCDINCWIRNISEYITKCLL